MKNKHSGFTLIELVLVMVIAMTLFGFVIFNMVGTQRTSLVNSVADVLVSEMASQQTKAMQGAGVTSGINYGIYFESGRYTLFQGNVYSPSDTRNYSVNMDSGVIISNITFPGNTLLFYSGSGTVSAYLNGNNTVTIQDSNGSKSKTITVNRYGVVTGLD